MPRSLRRAVRPASLRSRSLLGLCAAAVLVVTGCSSSKSTSGSSSSEANGAPITIAALSDLTGPQATGEAGAPEGVKAAVADVNANGGINGHPLKLAGPFDTQSTTAGGRSAGQQALSARPTVIVSTAFSSATTAVLPAFTTANIPFVNYGGGSDTVIPVKPNVFTLTPTANQDAVALLKQAQNSIKTSGTIKVGFVAIQAPASQAVSAEVKSIASKYNSDLVLAQSTPPGLTSFSSQAAQMNAAHPDVVILFDTLSSTVLETQALRTAGYQGLVIGATQAAANSALKKLNDPNFIAFRASAAAAPGEPLYQIAEKNGAAAQVADTGYFSAGWATVHVAAAILKKCGGTCDAKAFQNAAETMGNITVPNNALFGPVSFSPTEHFGLGALQFYKWDATKGVGVGEGPVATK